MMPEKKNEPDEDPVKVNEITNVDEINIRNVEFALEHREDFLKYLEELDSSISSSWLRIAALNAEVIMSRTIFLWNSHRCAVYVLDSFSVFFWL